MHPESSSRPATVRPDHVTHPHSPLPTTMPFVTASPFPLPPFLGCWITLGCVEGLSSRPDDLIDPDRPDRPAWLISSSTPPYRIAPITATHQLLYVHLNPGTRQPWFNCLRLGNGLRCDARATMNATAVVVVCRQHPTRSGGVCHL